MSQIGALNGRMDLRAHLDKTRQGGSRLKVDAWIPSEVKAISPLVDRLMRLIEESHCIPGEESAVELALSEALSNAVIHGWMLANLFTSAAVAKSGSGISLIVSD